ncbi:PilZ domain-containing protein [Mariprofundus erugo]|uniref:PilZ domain-containing protein n=1 Tax=Mariprofundus erugo TaxID=2528639 RepID=A0A5R9GXW5_9PROT|nr:PilZ domain-containing protein [Mariprofundus erugo]TLS68963.1 PilZ domain-containing protein [Mariprofundus erugo]TLS75257.1 PilZ domain-containing protein [Mariprofundus erugo]
MPDANRDNGRQDFRIDDMIPVSDEKLTQRQFDLYKTKVGVRSRQNSMLQQMVGKDVFAGQDHLGMNPDVAVVLESLDAKLNYLIGVNMLNDASHSDMQERPVNLSVTGISFVSDESYEVGDFVKVNLMLPSFPPSIMDLVGTIVRATKMKDGRTRIGTRFYYRCDDEEDTVAKYVYRRHREAIRAENRNAGL